MDVYDIRKILAENKLGQKYNEKEQGKYALDLLENDILNFNNAKKNSYLLKTIPYLYKLVQNEASIQKEDYDRLIIVRYKIQDLLHQNNLTIENHKILKILIGRLEMVIFSFPSSLDSYYQKEKIELLYYLIFSIKNINVLQSVLNASPHRLNMADQNGLSLVKEIVEKYLSVLSMHLENDNYPYLDDLLYYDRVLKLVLVHNKDTCTEENIKELDELFIQAEEKNPSSFHLQERYVYFLYKWREIFQNYLNDPKKSLNVFYSYTKEELEKQYLIETNFSSPYHKIANTVYISTKFPEVTPSMRRIYTIDSSGAVELDDGFSCTKENKHYRLGIHITNPLSYIKEDSLLFQQAYRRGSSIYLPDNTTFLFPLNLATDLFSLNSGEVRNCLSFYINVDILSKKIVKFEPLFESVFVKRNVTYKACNRILENNRQDSFTKTLNNLKEILPYLKQFYKIDNMYKKIKRASSNSTSTNIIGSTASEKIIETLMIFINSYYAKYAEANKIPCLFRNHEQSPFYKENLEKYIELFQQEKRKHLYMNELKILKSMYPASFYGVDNLGHYGLGVDAYTHITSPDRRIADDYNILMLQKYMDNISEESYKKEKAKLQRIGEYINERDRSINSFVNDYVSLTRKNKK